ncbi:piggyBac transposable element-derived protein 4-like [Schistocerca cancellata]|uniref:piggyBac transposable element-derived protein 4-like n=1 Tax=Schistocerca cancellata TaxID=274614 RepID=UPI0021178541|nr:piggyBac transposable element-derived protein 4-like [Schistocerca cancellata]
MKALLGVLVVMGKHVLPSFRFYWSVDADFGVPRISKVMSLKRFLKIRRNLHINYNENMPERGNRDFDKLYKFFNPSRYLFVDEYMGGFKGRSSLKQYIPLKTVTHGFKVWALSCAVTGVLLAFEVYEGYTIVPKSTFTCLFACGTMQTNRKFYPKHILCKDTDLQMGEIDFAAAGEVTVCKWKDRGKKCVVIGSNMHNLRACTVVRRRKKSVEKEEIPCILCIHEYNKYMGGVNLLDLLMSCYSISWKSRKRWMKPFYFVIDSAIVNAYIIYKTTMQLSTCREKPMTHLRFRRSLADELIGSYCSRVQKGRRPNVVSDVVAEGVLSAAQRKLSNGLTLPAKSVKWY